jgi:hypothetical protein
MSDFSISLVPRVANYSDRHAKATEILAWLVAEEIVKPTASNCVLGNESGYSIGAQAKRVTGSPTNLPTILSTNGLAITTERTVFHSDLEELVCPNCHQNIAAEDWDLTPWFEQESSGLICPQCTLQTEIHDYLFKPTWGFSALGFTFWNWPNFTPQFIKQFEQKLGCAIALVYQSV